jgi:hypothetical protein
MVCQEDRTWELILDISHCPDQTGRNGYDGLGCLGAADACSFQQDPSTQIDCHCDRKTERYSCDWPDMAKPDGG